MEKFESEKRYLIAKRRVDKLKGYFWHLTSYLVVNTVLSLVKIITDMQRGESFSEAFFDFGTFALWMFWGIGIFFHTLGMFGQNLMFGKKWEQKKINQILEKENQSHQKWM